MTAAAAPGQVVAAIIAGGAGTRLGGARKGDLLLAGRSIRERQLSALRPLFPRILLVGNDLAPLPPGVEAVPDRSGERLGPLAGLDAALAALRPGQGAVVCLAGDMPFPSPAALTLLRDGHPQAAALVPLVAGHPEPLFARYGQACAPVIAAALAGGRLKTSAFLAEVAVSYLDEATLRAADPHLLSLQNLNTPGDLARLEALALAHGL